MKNKKPIVRFRGEEPVGETIFSWEIPEFETYKRGRWWYAVVASIAGILIIYSLITLNFLFAFIIVIAGVILFLETKQKPRVFEFQITERGITVGTKYYDFKDIDKFWIIYEPPGIKNLYFSFKSITKTGITVPLEDKNPLEIRDTLLDFLSEDLDQEYETPTDAIRRFIKF